MQARPLAAAGLVLGSLLIAACGGSSPSTAASSPSPSAAVAGGAKVAVATNAKYGQILVDDKGITLYLFVADTGTSSTCYSSCASIWPPLLTVGAPQAGTGADQSLVGTTTRTDGKVEVTYAGHPLYSYVGDAHPGDITGQALNQFGAEWYVVGPGGSKIN